MARLRLLSVAILGALCSFPVANAGLVEGGPQKISQVSSIGESLHNAGQRAVHILYVHGIGATGAGDSESFRKSVCAFLKDCDAPKGPAPRDYADAGMFANGQQPPDFRYLGDQVWQNTDEWAASAPFVDHYVLHRRSGGTVVIDEINWWPLVFPLKCRAILSGEAHLAGPNAGYLRTCSQATMRDQGHPGRFLSYAWIDPQDAKKLNAMPSRAAWINRDLKISLLDWGFSDAVMAVGSLSDVFREGMRQLFLKSARFRADGSRTDEWMTEGGESGTADREFIVVSHSLGSYLVFSTLNVGAAGAEGGREDEAARYIMGRTSLVYFFANQVPLLELANVGKIGVDPGTPGGAVRQPVSMAAQITTWKQLRQNVARKTAGGSTPPPEPPQVIAWSDPSDLLSWYVPPLDEVIVVNLFVRNSWWHWLFEDPTAAHDNYATNGDVIRVMMGPPIAGAKSAN